MGSSRNYEDYTISIVKLTDFKGDADVCQRKGKVLTLFDLAFGVKLEIKKDSEEVGTAELEIPELSHDLDDIDEIQVYIRNAKGSEGEDKIKEVVKKGLIPDLKPRLLEFKKVLIKTHGVQIQHDLNEVKSNFTKQNQQESLKEYSKPSNSNEKSSSKSSSTVNVANNTGRRIVNTEPTIKKTYTFKAPVDSLIKAMTTPDLVAIWSRAKNPIISAQPSEYSLFNGSITGKILSVTSDSINLTWRTNNWPTEHFSEQKLSFVQNDSLGETELKLEWSGIPIGEDEGVIKRFEEYYVKAIKLAFGYGSVL